jgi:hypothetical protein
VRTRYTMLIGAAWLAGAVAAPSVWAQASQTGIVCWIDEHGARACGDHVPPQYAKRQREIYDSRGVLVRRLKAEETPEERIENERRERDALRAVQQQQQQLANDSFMLQTYRTLDELKAARDVRLQLLDTRIELGQKAVRDGEAGMKQLQDRADEALGSGRDPDPELQNQIKAFAASEADNIRAVAQIRQDREATAAQFDHYVQRYQELHGVTPLPPPTPQAPPPPGAPPPPAAPQPEQAPRP